MSISTKNEQLILAKERLSKRELTPITEDNKHEYYKNYESMWFEESDWDEVINIFQNAIKRKGLTKEEVKEISDRILDEK